MPDHDPSSVSTLLSRLGGADSVVLKLAPKARREYMALALVMLATASMAVLSMAFAMTGGLKANLIVAIFVGLFWGAIILTIDRALVINLKPKGGTLRLVAMILPRLVMAVLLGLVVSTPLTLRIFSNEISGQITQDQIATANAAATQIKNGDLQRLLDQKNADITKYQAIMDGKLNYTSPSLTQVQQEYDTANADYQAKQKDAETAYRKWQCELYGSGCEGASERQGDGPLAKALKKEYDTRVAAVAQAKATLDTKHKALTKAQSDNETDANQALADAQADAKTQLAILGPQRDKIRQQLQALSDEAQGQKENGLLAQLVALDHLGDHNGLARMAQILLAALFFMIELLPVAVKTLTSIGPTSVYERVDKLDDDNILKLAESKAGREQLKQDQIDKRAVESEVRVTERVQARVEKVVTELAMAAVDRWGVEVRESAAAYAAQSPPQVPQPRQAGETHTAPPAPGPYNLPPDGRFQPNGGPHL